MSLVLPNKISDFGTNAYWEKFFTTINSTFEWYGDFDSLSKIFLQNIRSTDAVLEVGCGNSQLCRQIHDEIGCKQVLGIDTSEKAILEVSKLNLNELSRPGLKFAVLDVFLLSSGLSNLGLSTPCFNCVIDKGTLDAIYSGNEVETRIREYFANITSSLLLFGRYIVITLAQDHIIRSIAEHFLNEGCDWVVTCIHNSQPSRENESKFALPVFVLIMTKMRTSSGLPQLRLQGSGEGKPGKPVFTNLKQCLCEWVKRCQHESLLLEKIRSEPNYEFNLQEAISGVPLFFCKIISSHTQARSVYRTKPQGVFIVPSGRNNTHDFSSISGQNLLLESMGLSCILLVFTSPSVWFRSVDAVKSCLSDALSSSLLASLVISLPIYCTEDGYPDIRCSEVGSPSSKSIIVSPDVNGCKNGCCLSRSLTSNVFLLRSVHLCPHSIAVLNCKGFVAHFLAWLSIFNTYWNRLLTSGESAESKRFPQSTCVYLGIPQLLPLPTCSPHLHICIDPIFLSTDIGEPVKSLLTQLCYSGRRKKRGVSNTAVPNFFWHNELSSIYDEVEMIIYDPPIECETQYLKAFSASTLAIVLQALSRKLRRNGFALIVSRPLFEVSPSVHLASVIAEALLPPFEVPELCTLLTYEVPAAGVGDTACNFTILCKSHSASLGRVAGELNSLISALLKETPENFGKRMTNISNTWKHPELQELQLQLFNASISSLRCIHANLKSSLDISSPNIILTLSQ